MKEDVNEPTKFLDTLTYNFLLPLIPDNSLSEIANKNAFLYYESYPNFQYSLDNDLLLNPHIFVLCHKDNNVTNITCKKKLMLPNSDLLLLVYEMPVEHHKEYVHFIKGEYSLFSQSSKLIIKRYMEKYHSNRKFVYQALNKDLELSKSWANMIGMDYLPIDQEYYFKPSILYNKKSQYPSGEVLTDEIIEILKNNFKTN